MRKKAKVKGERASRLGRETRRGVALSITALGVMVGAQAGDAQGTEVAKCLAAPALVPRSANLPSPTEDLFIKYRSNQQLERLLRGTDDLFIKYRANQQIPRVLSASEDVFIKYRAQDDLFIKYRANEDLFIKYRAIEQIVYEDGTTCFVVDLLPQGDAEPPSAP